MGDALPAVSKLRFTAAFVLCLLLTPALVQSLAPPKGTSEGCEDDGCLEIGENGKCGLGGPGHGAKSRVIPPRYDAMANGFAHGMIKVKERGKWGCLNQRGEMAMAVAI